MYGGLKQSLSAFKENPANEKANVICNVRLFIKNE